jgi:hypothetical protein
MTRTAAKSAGAGAATEIAVDRLIGRQVISVNNRRIGRLEEVRVEKQGADFVVTDYVIGRAGLLERLGVAFKLLFGASRGGYLARWDQVDVSDPRRPRLRCTLEELRRM